MDVLVSDYPEPRLYYCADSTGNARGQRRVCMCVCGMSYVVGDAEDLRSSLRLASSSGFLVGRHDTGPAACNGGRNALNLGPGPDLLRGQEQRQKKPGKDRGKVP